VWWRYLLVGALVYILSNIVFAVGYFTGVMLSGAPNGSGSVFVYSYAFFTIVTVGSIPAVVTAVLYYVLTAIAKRLRERIELETGAMTALILLIVLGLVFTVGFVVPQIMVRLA
jgi:hypothetical protein